MSRSDSNRHASDKTERSGNVSQLSCLTTHGSSEAWMSWAGGQDISLSDAATATNSAPSRRQSLLADADTTARREAVRGDLLPAPAGPTTPVAVAEA